MKKILMTGGGSAGHVTPNIALFPALREAGYEIHYAGLEDGIEHGLITAQEGVTFHPIESGKLRRYLCGKIAHAGIHPITGARFVRKPPVNRQNHFIGFRGIIKGFILIPKPKKFAFTVSLTKINTKNNQLFINGIPECVRFGCIGSTFNSDCPLIVCIAGSTP